MLRQTLSEALGNLGAARQRSTLALLGILIGAGAVAAMLNIGAIAQNETVKQFRQMGTDILLLRSSNPGGLRLADVQGIPAAVPQVPVVAPLIQGGDGVSFAGTARNASIVGTTEALAAIARLTVRSGRFLSSLDRFELYCVLGSRLADELSGPAGRLGVGSQLRVGRHVITVIGILEAAMPSPILPLDMNDSLFVSIPNGKRLMTQPMIYTVVARLAPGTESGPAANALQAYFAPKPGSDQLDIQNAAQLIATMRSQMQLFELLLGAVGSIALVLGGVGVMNIMLVSVQERRREIGIRLAVGARQRDVQLLFLSEAVILAVLGGILGAGLGVGTSYAFARLSDWEFLMSPSAAPIGAGVSVAVGILFGLYPAIAASRLDPIEALRAE